MGAGDGAAAADLSALPAVHELAAALDAPHALAVAAAARRAIDEQRARRCSPAAPPSEATCCERARELLAELEQPSLRRVINATGVIVHTNLGRAPLPQAAREARARAAPAAIATSSSTSSLVYGAPGTRTSRGCCGS